RPGRRRFAYYGGLSVIGYADYGWWLKPDIDGKPQRDHRRWNAQKRKYHRPIGVCAQSAVVFVIAAVPGFFRHVISSRLFQPHISPSTPSSTKQAAEESTHVKENESAQTVWPESRSFGFPDWRAS